MLFWHITIVDWQQLSDQFKGHAWVGIICQHSRRYQAVVWELDIEVNPLLLVLSMIRERGSAIEWDNSRLGDIGVLIGLAHTIHTKTKKQVNGIGSLGQPQRGSLPFNFRTMKIVKITNVFDIKLLLEIMLKIMNAWGAIPYEYEVIYINKNNAKSVISMIDKERCIIRTLKKTKMT